MAMKQAQIISHRGGAYLWPENSLLAFRQSLTLPVEVLNVTCIPHPMVCPWCIMMQRWNA